MAWFRWHEGTCLDAKFHLMARKSGQPVAFCLAVWAMLLERASAAEERGDISGFDCESADAALGMPDGAAQAIYDAMLNKGMIKDGRIAKWDERQPKKEDDGSLERKRRQREKEKADSKAEDSQDVTACHGASRHVTDCHAMSHDVTACHGASRDVTPDKIRGEERIKEIKESFCAEPCSSTQSGPAKIPETVLPEKDPVITLPLNTGPEYPVMAEKVSEWQRLYPAVDVFQQLRNMRGWLLENKSRRKTASGIGRFINSWLAREQDKGPRLRLKSLKQDM